VCPKALEYCGNKEMVVCEVGVARDDNALCMLRFMPIKQLFLVNPHMSYIEDSDSIVIYSEEHVIEKEIAYDKLSNYKKVDFVYIDGDHSLAYEDMVL